jgi:hypothetical protein
MPYRRTVNEDDDVVNAFGTAALKFSMFMFLFEQKFGVSGPMRQLLTDIYTARYNNATTVGRITNCTNEEYQRHQSFSKSITQKKT